MARRTRAQQSLIDFSLEELEQMLELDEEDAAAAEDANYESFIQVGLARGGASAHPLQCQALHCRVITVQFWKQHQRTSHCLRDPSAPEGWSAVRRRLRLGQGQLLSGCWHPCRAQHPVMCITTPWLHCGYRCASNNGAWFWEGCTDCMPGRLHVLPSSHL